MSLLTEGFGAKSYFAPDYIFNNTALANAGTVTSSEFQLGGSMAGIEIVGVAGTEITIANGQTLIYSIVTADVSGGTFNSTVFTKTFTDETIANGAELFRYIPTTDVEVFAKVTAVTTADQSSDKHTVTIRRVPR